MKFSWLYYMFGGFIGGVCGFVVCLIFLMVERSGQPILSSLPQKFGIFGEYLLMLYNVLPFFGIVLGVILVRKMFPERFEDEDKDKGTKTP